MNVVVVAVLLRGVILLLMALLRDRNISAAMATVDIFDGISHSKLKQGGSLRSSSW